ncbi:MAG: hypothetical protein ACE5Z5_11485 [Candidatus Bathyarchaeia archaeon]
MRKTDVFGRLLGWCRNPKTKLQELNLHISSLESRIIAASNTKVPWGFG